MYHAQPVNIDVLRRNAGGERREMVKDILEKAKRKSHGSNRGAVRGKAEKKVGEEVVELLNDIADAVIEGKINSGMLDIGNGMKAKIAVTAKGLVKVEKTVTEKGTKEV